MKKETFIKPDDEENSDSLKHLYFVISDPDVDNNVLLVNLTTMRNKPGEDKSCILNIGDHPFIKHKSIIDYKRAVSYDAIRLLRAKFNTSLRSIIQFKEELDDEILLKIQQGAQTSPLFPRSLKCFFQYF